MAAPTIRSDGHGAGTGRAGDGVPGVVLVFASGRAVSRVLPLSDGPLELGREQGSPGELDDDRVSRHHAVVELQRRWCVVTDLGSTNGTYVDGKRIAKNVATRVERVLRVGGALLVPCVDVRPIQQVGVRKLNGFVYGPAVQAVVEDAERAGRTGMTLHIRGPTGSGKEGIAQAFHRATGRARMLVPVNCSTIKESLAEAQLFGSRRGAFTGADKDTAGHIQEADGGTLFLDEIGDLDLDVQAKLLRVLESGEVMALGTSKPRKVNFALCSATHKDLRMLVEAGRFREDLYHRIARPAVTLPPLCDRPEEVPALVEQVLSRGSPAQVAHASLVEICLLRPWPGNVRELLIAIADAASRAAAAEDDRVAAHHLADDAGTVFGRSILEAAGPVPHGPEPRGTGPRGTADGIGGRQDEPRKQIRRNGPEWRERIIEALNAHANNKSAAARALGMYRTELCRQIDRLGIVVGEPAKGSDEPGDPAERDEPTGPTEPDESDE